MSLPPWYDSLFYCNFLTTLFCDHRTPKTLRENASKFLDFGLKKCRGSSGRSPGLQNPPATLFEPKRAEIDALQLPVFLYGGRKKVWSFLSVDDTILADNMNRKIIQ